MRRVRALLVAFGVAALPWTGGRAQSGPPLANATLTHVGVAVRDVEKSAKAYAEVFGVPVPTPSVVSADLPQHGQARFKTAIITLPDFRIDLGEPLGDDNPYTPFLEKYGEGIQHLGVVVPDALQDRVKALMGRGGTLTLGRPGGSVAFLDFTDLLGTTIEIAQQRSDSAPGPAVAATAQNTLSTSAVSHVGLILSDVEKTAGAFASLMGAAPPNVIVARAIDFPPDYAGDRNVEVKLSMARIGAISLELQQDPGGSNPWNDSARRFRGNGVEHIAFTIQGDLNAMRAHLAKQGGREVLGGPGSRYPHFEFFSKLGMMIELLGTPNK